MVIAKEPRLSNLGDLVYPKSLITIVQDLLASFAVIYISSFIKLRSRLQCIEVFVTPGSESEWVPRIQVSIRRGAHPFLPQIYCSRLPP